MRKQRAAVGVFLNIFFLVCIADTPGNFLKAKRYALAIFEDNPISLYCGCPYNNPDKKVDLKTCQMHQAEAIKRANRIEWEHMMPASQFGHKLKCWKKDICHNKKKNQDFHGRKCCQKISPEFNAIEAELYNIWPAVGMINQVRSNYNYAMIDNKRGFYGCSFDFNRYMKIAEPPDRAKGIVARANLFMRWKYGIALQPDYEKLLRRWNEQYPPSEWEIIWANRVAQIEMYPNPFIQFYHDKDRLNRHLA